MRNTEYFIQQWSKQKTKKYSHADLCDCIFCFFVLITVVLQNFCKHVTIKLSLNKQYEITHISQKSATHLSNPQIWSTFSKSDIMWSVFSFSVSASFQSFPVSNLLSVSVIPGLLPNYLLSAICSWFQCVLTPLTIYLFSVFSVTPFKAPSKKE